ncbi:hypothetical protein GE061_019718 [Apolygus lucorum]|uniref:Uncharacterized protein n=1 Tax=Apolygus lucorum TaxID=248454 RepID=A0A8S9XD97_APOLU|nr:hypothetical protein GE061_019718 [Apolygus lucorum]
MKKKLSITGKEEPVDPTTYGRAELSFKLPAVKMKVLLLLFALVAMTCAYVVVNPIPCLGPKIECGGPLRLNCNYMDGTWECIHGMKC